MAIPLVHWTECSTEDSTE
jgi:hypothetical protein